MCHCESALDRVTQNKRRRVGRKKRKKKRKNKDLKVKEKAEELRCVLLDGVTCQPLKKRKEKIVLSYQKCDTAGKAAFEFNSRWQANKYSSVVTAGNRCVSSFHQAGSIYSLIWHGTLIVNLVVHLAAETLHSMQHHAISIAIKHHLKCCSF